MVFRLEDKWQNYRSVRNAGKPFAPVEPSAQGLQTPDEDFSMYPSLQTSPQEAKKPLPRILRWLGFSSLGIVVVFLLGAPLVVNALESAEDSQMAIAAISDKKGRIVTEEKKPLLQAMGQNISKMAESFMPQAQASTEGIMLLELAEEPGMLAADVGKSDPFAPSFSDYTGIDPDTGVVKEKEVDVMDFIRFTGLIDDDNAGDRVVVLEINDPEMGTYTEVKKMGYSLSLMGKTVKLMSVSGETLSLTVDGARRSMLLTPYSDIAVTSSGSTAGTSSGTSGSSAVPDSVTETIGELEEM